MELVLLPRAPGQAGDPLDPLRTRKFIDIATAILNSMILDGTIVLDGTAIELGAGALEKVILGDAFKAYFDTHIHGHAMGPTLVPTVLMPAATLSTVVKVKP